MSDLAEYARGLHEAGQRDYPRDLEPFAHECGVGALKGVRAVVFDVYGTMVNYWRPGFEERQSRDELLIRACSEIVERFGMGETLLRINPQEPPAKTLNDFYNGLIALNRQKSADAEFAEVRVDEVWTVILMMLRRNGYDVGAHVPGGPVLTPTQTSAQTSSTAVITDFARYLSYTYNFFAMGRALYSGVSSALKKLKGDNIVLGIMADAQLYTPIDLTLLLRDQSGGGIDDYSELFDADLTFFSYQYGFVKPSEVLYRRLFDALYEYHILPSQTVFVGNDLLTDIKPAAALGMRTALFCGDGVMRFGIGESVVPDVVFKEWGELPDLISFHGEA